MLSRLNVLALTKFEFVLITIANCGKPLSYFILAVEAQTMTNVP